MILYKLQKYYGSNVYESKRNTLLKTIEKSKNATGPGEISSILLKQCILIIIEPLIDINGSISVEIFPYCLKKFHIKAIHKKGEKKK